MRNKIDETEKFWNPIHYDGECLRRSKSAKTYTKFRLNSGKMIHAHRYIYEWVNGLIPNNWHIHHKCKNAWCVHPFHLEAKSPRKHVMDNPVAIAKINSLKTHCKNGHEFTTENTYHFRLKNGKYGRQCRFCRNRHLYGKAK